MTVIILEADVQHRSAATSPGEPAVRGPARTSNTRFILLLFDDLLHDGRGLSDDMHFLEHPLNGGGARSMGSRAPLDRLRSGRCNDTCISRSGDGDGPSGKSFGVVLSLSDCLVLGRDLDGRFRNY